MILMDTHIFLWFQLGAKDLKEFEIQKIIEAHQRCELCLSAISIWEIAMLEKLGRIAFHQPLNVWLKNAIKDIKMIAIDPDIALESVCLPDLAHQDPADRLIIATARVFNAELITHDQKLIDYADKGFVNILT